MNSPDISTIPGIRGEEVQKLRKIGVKTVDEFQALLDQGNVATLQDVGKNTGIDRVMVAQLLANSIQGSAHSILNPSLKRHWADATVLLLVAFLLWEVVRPWVSPSPIRVVAAAEIPAFSIILDSQLKAEGSASEGDSKKTRSQFTGKYALRAFHPGDPIPAVVARVSATDLAGATILRIPVKSMPPLKEDDLPRHILLIASAKDATAEGTVLRALLLGIEDNGSALTVGLSAEDLKAASKRLTSSDVYVALQLP